MAVLLVGAVTAFRYLGRGRAPAASDASGSETVVVDSGPVSVLLKETGVVRPRQSVAVKSKVSGKVREVLVAEGDVVRQGQLLAVVDPDAQASLTLSQKRLELRRLKVELDQKERAWKRQAQLAREGLVSDELAEEAERDFRVAQNLFLQARTALNLLETEANQELTADGALSLTEPGGVTDYRILSPLAGVVSSVKVKPGEMATSGTTGFSQEGALLMEISDQRQLEVVVNINEIAVPKLRPGMPAKVTLAAAPGAPIAAVVDRVAVSPLVEANATPDSGKVIVFPVALRLPERPAELLQGMSASVDITREERPFVVRIPILAFAEKDGKAFVRMGGKEQPRTPADREVTLGLRGNRFVEVTAGLKVGDVILARYPLDDGKKGPGGGR